MPEHAEESDGPVSLAGLSDEAVEDIQRRYNVEVVSDGVEQRADAVNFSNVGGDPFESQDVLRAFLNDLAAVADRVWLGDNEWPGPDVEEWPLQPDGDHFPIHDRPVVAEGVDLDEAAAVYETYEADAYALGGPRPVDGDTAMKARQQRSARPIGIDVPGGPVGALTREADDEFDPDDPPEEFREAIEADTFVIYGKASVENYDELDTRFSVAALEDALGRFFESKDAPGIISRGHSDVVVGMPVREHTLESDTTLVIDGETYQFDAGETIRSEAKDADGDEVPELWLASRLANDSDIARETRYQALTGELNGYSVTIKPKEGATRETAEGEDVLALDLHAVTVGTDEQILNKGSKFDVAEFRAQLLARADDAASAGVSAAEDLVLDIIPMSDETQSADSGEDQGFMARILPRAADDTDEEPNTEQRAGDDEDHEGEEEGRANPIYTALEDGKIDAGTAERLREMTDGASEEEVSLVVDKVAEGDLDEEEAATLLGANGGGEPDMAAGDDDDDVGEEEPEELRGEDEDDEDDESRLAERLEAVENTAERLDAIESRLEEIADASLTESELLERLENSKLELDEELVTRSEFDDTMQRAVGVTPSPNAGETDDSGSTLRESLGLKSGGD